MLMVLVFISSLKSRGLDITSVFMHYNV